MAHQLSTGLTWTDFRMASNTQVYNLAGIGQIDGSVQVGPNTESPYPTAARRERSTELHLRDRIDLASATRLWLGVRHTQLDRSSDDGPAYNQAFTTPWVALSQQLSDATLVYASWGQGVETEVVPNLPMYANRNQALPALKSEQVEVGLKFNQADWTAGLTLFDVRRPFIDKVGACDGSDDSCVRRIDGNARHRGIEANAEARWSQLTLQASAQWLRARRQGATEVNRNGLTPPNVAERSARVLATWQVPSFVALSLQASVTHESPRYVLPDDSARIPGWTTFGLTSRYSTRAFGHEWLLRVGVDNLFDRRAWKESPYQFEHAYLYPLEPRTFRASLQATL
jgi:iron complex outermembrane receptor protein